MKQSKNHPQMYDLDMYLQVGMNPDTGLPVKMNSAVASSCKEDIKAQLRIVDRTDAINRFKYHNLPKGLTPDILERVVYFRGQGILFHIGDRHFCLPYALDGTIDMYGRFEDVTPLPFNGTNDSDKKEKPWIQGLRFKPVYEVPDFEEFAEKSEDEIREFIEKSCVIIRDHSIGISQMNLPKSQTQECILDVMSDCIPFMRTALVNSTGVLGMRVEGADEAANVYAASSAINIAALTGQKYVPIEGMIEFQELTGGSTAKSQEFFLAMQSLDNYRLSQYGLENGGLFQKNQHMLQEEQDMKNAATSLVLQDALRCRQEALTIYNAINGTSMWVEINEDAMNNGLNMADSEENTDNEENTATEGGNSDADI